jgi:hypothetical protein
LQGEYVMGEALSKLYSAVVFLDDDAPCSPDAVSTLLAEADQFPNTVLSGWALNFENPASYWDRTMPPVHAPARYCGSAQMVVPAALLANASAMLAMFPAEYRAVSDLWFDAYVVLQARAELRRSAVEVHATRAGDDYAAGRALSQQPGMRDLKTAFMQYLSAAHLWPFVGSTANFAAVNARAQTQARHGALAAAVGTLQLAVASWPHYSQAWNNLAVALIRTADTMPSGPARLAVLERAADALDRAEALPDKRDESKIAANRRVVRDMRAR